MWHKNPTLSELAKIREGTVGVATSLKIIGHLGFPSMYPAWFKQQSLSMAFISKKTNQKITVEVNREGKTDTELAHSFNMAMLDTMGKLPDDAVFPVVAPADIRNVKYAENSWVFMSKGRRLTVETYAVESATGEKRYMVIKCADVEILARPIVGSPEELRAHMFSSLLRRVMVHYKELYQIPIIADRVWSIEFHSYG